jgi:DNA-binding CsgD family transcriptional regulator
MRKYSGSYKLFFDFIKYYSPVGFKGIKRDDPLILALEKMMKDNNQFFLIFDMIRMRVNFSSKGCKELLGIDADDISPYHFKEATHPDDLKRHELGIVKLFKTAHELYIKKKGEVLISTNFKFRNSTGNYSNQLVQIYIFYSPLPNDTVYMININTDIDWYRKFKNGFHYYIGDDFSNFRYPDQELLRIGHSFTAREFEIIRMVKAGYDSELIAEKLFLSKHTVNTHRKNILEKSGYPHMTDLIFSLEEQGLL